MNDVKWNSNIPDGNDAPHSVASTSQIGPDSRQDAWRIPANDPKDQSRQAST
jgi:hypothetical protein